MSSKAGKSRWSRMAIVPVVLAAVIAGGGPRAATPQDAQVRWQGIERVVAFADVHGAYDELHGLLLEAGILDAQDRWAAGRAHVVSLGDLLDRGAGSRKVMDLLMRLQVEARAAGGELHVVLGNHEAMNLLGDLRYVEAAEFAAYADIESAAERARARETWEAAHGAESGTDFDRAFPPGYFGHRTAFSPEGLYGRWLLALPVAIVIDGTLFMHGGPSEILQGMTLEELNLRYRTALTEYLGTAARLEQAKLLEVGDSYDARPQLARDRLAAAVAAGGGTPDPAIEELARRFESAAGNVLLWEEGPNWYRGAATCREAAEADTLNAFLQQIDARKLVIGHTPTRDGRAVTRFEGRVVKLDAGMNHAVYKGRAAALSLAPSGLTVRYAGEPGLEPPNAEGLFVAPDAVDEASVLATLREGEVTVTGPRGSDELAVSVSHGGRTIPAVFQARGKRAARLEVAAYRLDRRLQLGLVPVTVEREVQGQPGVLQARPASWVTQADVQQQSLRLGGWCRAEPQFQLIYAFDTLIGNEGRTAESLVYDSDNGFVYVSAHERAFGTAKGLPAYLKARTPKPGAEVRRRFGALDAAILEEVLGDLVDARARKAILERRDALLALPAAVETPTSP
jgi:hypothetical protein